MKCTILIVHLFRFIRIIMRVMSTARVGPRVGRGG
jgi:hypothetical protein